MAVCNLFKKLTKTTGNFLMFSQYTEDLIKGLSDPNYKVIPSKFIAMDLRYNPIDHFGSNDPNITVPTFFQNFYENACAYLRSNIEQWIPEYASNIFWRCLCRYQDEQIDQLAFYDLIQIDKKTGITDQIKWVGDINIQSHSIHDGMGYSELFCHIPSSASQLSCQFDITGESDQGMQDTRGKIEGWDIRESGMLNIQIPNPTTYYYTQKWIPKFLDSSNDSKYTQVNQFNINTIVILYDCVDSKGNVLHKDIPMGLYITGLINNDGTVNNSIIKYVSHEDIYDSGTSYGLRICSRFSLTPRALNIETISINTEDGEYSALSEAMTKMSDSQTKMDILVKNLYDNSQNYKDLYAIFKNSRTNVPYIKTWNNKSYWFINGRNTGVEASGGGNNSLNLLDIATRGEVQAVINGLENLLATQINVIVSQDSDKFEKGTVNDFTFDWVTYFEGDIITPDSITVNGNIIDNESNSFTTQVSDDSQFILNFRYGNFSAEKIVTANFVWPTFVGLLTEEQIDPNNLNLEVAKLSKKLIGFNLYEYKFSNYSNKHVCYAHPIEYGELNSIIDQNGYIYSIGEESNRENEKDGEQHDFYKSIISLEVNGEQHDYYVYIDREPVVVVDQKLKFN